MMKQKFYRASMGILIGSSFLAPPAFSQTLESYKDQLMGYVNKIPFFASRATAPACAPPLSLVKGSPECMKRYQDLYSKPDVNVTMAFGYSDTRPNPSLFSGVSAHNFMQGLTRACATDGSDPSSVCGFSQDSSDPTLFSKSVVGPDGKNHQFKIHVISAVDPDNRDANDDDLNKSAAQKARSAKTTQAFEQALQQGGVVMYDGPSRDCAGPDFNPPVLKSDNSVDDAYYQKNHSSVNEMVKSLSTPGQHPSAIALFSSNSKSCFTRSLNAASPTTALLTSNVEFSTDPVDVMYSQTQQNAEKNFIDGLMNLRCDDGLVQSMQDGSNSIFELNGWGVKH